MVTWELKFTNRAKKDIELLNNESLKRNAKKILEILKVNPYKIPPSFEKLKADLKGCFSRRLNREHRVVYGIKPEMKQVVIYGLHGHYE